MEATASEALTESDAPKAPIEAMSSEVTTAQRMRNIHNMDKNSRGLIFGITVCLDHEDSLQRRYFHYQRRTGLRSSWIGIVAR